MPEEEGQGLLASIRRLGNSALSLVRTRLALFAVELQEEKLRTLNLLAWFCLAVAVGVAGLLVAIATLALFLWQRAGYPGLLALASVMLAVAAVLFWMLRRRLRDGPRPFADTAAEFEKDVEWLRQRD